MPQSLSSVAQMRTATGIQEWCNFPSEKNLTKAN